MTTFPGSPSTLKAALVAIEEVGFTPTVIPFQYNPTGVNRSFEVQGASGGPEVGQLTGPPRETIQLEAVLDATDALEAGQGSSGVSAHLAALQGLVTPRSADVLEDLRLQSQGSIEILPPRAPVTLLVWGPRRVLPVAVTEISIFEEAHDASLAPILARVSLGLRVLTYHDLPSSHPAHALALAGQVAREVLAEDAVTTSLESTLGSNTPLL